MLSEVDATGLVKNRLLPDLQTERSRLDAIDKWYRWEQDEITLPQTATKELRSLAQLARTPWLGLVVTTVAQTMFVDGFRSPAADDDLPGWGLWLENGLDARQVAIHRAMLAYGTSYMTILPAKRPDGSPTALMRGVSPRRMLAWFDDPIEDDWPVYAVQDRGKTVRLFDDEAIYEFRRVGKDGALDLTDVAAHVAQVCPVTRYTNQFDLDGRSPGEVEPHIPLAKRINKTVYDRLLAQHFGSWTVRTVAGMAAPDDDEDKVRKKLQLRQDDILIAEDPDTKFGTLPPTPLDGLLNAAESDIRALAAATQTPVHALVGDLINLSAEALASARATADAKSAERKITAGRSHTQALRLASFLAGDVVSASDPMAHVTWQDTSIRSLAQAADGLGKIAQMLGVPQRGLWPMIPGVTRSQVAVWEQMADDAFGTEDVLRALRVVPDAVED